MLFSELFAKLKNVFKNSKLYASALSCPESNIKLPTRQDFQNDALIDFYKTEYQTALSNIKHSNALVLEADELNYNITMIIELLENIYLTDRDKNLSIYKRKINYLINCAKLKLYLNDIITYQNEVIARLIALNEVKKEKFILSRLKKEAINNVLNRLYISLNILITNQISIINSIRSYLNNNLYESVGILEQAVIKKIDYLTWLQNILPTEERVKLDINSKSIYSDIAKATILLEKYAYMHKDEITIESKQTEIEAILAIPFDEEHKDEILHKIDEIEIKYRVFYDYTSINEYKDIPIDETDLATLYSLKFNALVGNAVIVDTIIILKNIKDEIEREYYESIVIDMYQRIILGQNEIFNKLFKDNFTLAIDIIKEIYKNRLITVLNNDLLLSLLLALNSEDGLNKLLDQNASDYFLPYYMYDSHAIRTKDYVPLSTLYYFESLQDENDIREPFYEDRVNIYKLYFLYRRNNFEDDDKYYMPEGIESIIFQLQAQNNSILNVYTSIQESATNRTVYFPSSLKKISLEIFANVPVKGFVLNEGLETLENADCLFKCKTINFPSTIKAITKTASEISPIENVIVNISKNNAPILDDKNPVNAQIIPPLLKFFEKGPTWEYYLESNYCKNIIIHINELDEDIIINPFMIYEVFYNFAIWHKTHTNDYFKDLIYKKLQIYKEFNKLLPQEKQISISDNPLSMINDCETVRANLKEYVQNSEEEEKQILEKFKQIVRLHEILDTYKFEDILDDLNLIEPNLLAFARYGNNKYIDNDTVYNFYVLKFRALTSGEELIKPFISVQSSQEEIACYERFILDSLQGTYHKLFETNIFTDGTFGEDTAKLRETLTDILKNGEEEIDPYKILTDYYLLNIFLSMFSSKDNPFHRMFQLRVGDMYFSRDLYKKSKMYTFRSEINLHEAMEIYYYSKMDYTDIKEPFIYSDSYFKISKSLYDFYDLYLKYYLPFKIENENFGHFPDFIIQIHTDFYNDPTTPKKEIAMLDKLREINRGKYVVFPNVQVIEGSVPLFGGVPVAGIGGGHFTHIMGKVFADQSFEVLSLPQSVYVIDKKAINFLSVKVLRLTNFYSDDLHSHTSYFGNFFYQQERDGKTVYATNLQKIIFDFNDFRLLEITEYQYVLDIEKDIELLQDYDLTEEPIKAMIEKLHLDKKLLPSYIYRVSKKEDEKRAKALHYQLARIKKKKED